MKDSQGALWEKLDPVFEVMLTQLQQQLIAAIKHPNKCEGSFFFEKSSQRSLIGSCTCQSPAHPPLPSPAETPLPPPITRQHSSSSLVCGLSTA